MYISVQEVYRTSNSYDKKRPSLWLVKRQMIQSTRQKKKSKICRRKGQFIFKYNFIKLTAYFLVEILQE